MIIKRRLPKKYRLPELDLEIRSHRTIHEPQLIHSAKEAGVPTPTIFMVDLGKTTIIMEFVEGKQVKQILDYLPKKERPHFCQQIGELIGRLHHRGIIHGDLTTSNMILNSYNRVVFIDFGLSEKSTEIEARGVDLHLMKRVLESTHFKHAKECFNSIMEGYSKVMGNAETKKVLKKIQEIERRGRYVSTR